MMRKSLGIRNWESAQKIVRDWEARTGASMVSVKEALERYIADCEARSLRDETLRKYRLMQQGLSGEFGGRPLDAVGIDELSRYREKWTLAPGTARTKIGILRAFFRFCVDRGWIEKNPALLLKHPRAVHKPTLPFTDEEMVRILAAVEKYPDHPLGRRKRLRAFVLLLRYAGLRIGDAVCLAADRIADGTVFLYTAKTGAPVRCPLPQSLIDNIEDMRKVGERFLFFSGYGKVKTAMGNWQRTLERLFKIAQVENAHPHRFRDTFATDLLAHGVPLEDVSILLGHSSLKVTEKHYAPWVKIRQDRLEAEVRRAWL
jgi:integrase